MGPLERGIDRQVDGREPLYPGISLLARDAYRSLTRVPGHGSSYPTDRGAINLCGQRVLAQW
jgi:hypothetical protein